MNERDEELRRLRLRVLELEGELAEWQARDRAEDVGDLEGARIEATKRAFGLTRTEAWILLELIDHAPAIRRKGDLLDRRPYADVHETCDQQVIAVFISKLRRKLGVAGFPGVIRTAWGVGAYIDRSVAAVLRERVDGRLAA